jgi:hexosaminidase
MPEGEALPKFEKIQPLTAEEEKNILGGEACQWSEMVDNRTIDSRIWPRAAVVAEKLWSPQVLTSNVDDMYRRLMELDDDLDQMGIQHQTSGPEIVQNIVQEPYQKPLQNLVDVLQEDEFFNRMLIYEPQLYTNTPLNRIVDAARPESYVAYRFNKDVDLYLETNDPAAKERILEELRVWSKNHEQLAPALGIPEKYIEDSPLSLKELPEENSRLKEVEAHSKNLSALSELALSVLNGQSVIKNDPEMDSLFIDAGMGHGGTKLPIESGLKKLIQHNQE